MERKNKERKPIFYKDDSEMDKPLSELMENLRTDITKIRGKLFDIKQSFGWDDRISHLEGGLTCMIVAMYETMRKFKEFEDRQLKKLQ
jgi:hypothetical protein